MLECTIDFDRPGIQVGDILLNHSNDRYAFATIPIPIVVVNGGPGPTVLLTAGVHGNEYEGIAILRNLISTVDPSKITGRLIIIPATNYPAFRSATRVSPIDQLNMNRVFPGDPDGQPTEQLAYFIEKKLLPMTQYACDFHTGNQHSEYSPCTYIYGINDEMMQGRLDAVRAFGAPSCVVVPGVGSAGSLTSATGRHGCVSVATELGGGAVPRKENVKIGQDGLQRLLAHWKVIELTSDLPTEKETEFFEIPKSTGRIMAPIDGLFVPEYEMGQWVKSGELAGRMYSIDDVGRPPVDVEFSCDGSVRIVTTRALNERGDYLCFVGTTVDPTKYLQPAES